MSKSKYDTGETVTAQEGSPSRTINPGVGYDHAEPTVYAIETEEQRVRLTLVRFLARTGSLHGFWPATQLETQALTAILKARPRLGIPAGYTPDNKDKDNHLAILREHRRQAILDGVEPRYLNGVENDLELSLLGTCASDMYDSDDQIDKSFFEEACYPQQTNGAVEEPQHLEALVLSQSIMLPNAEIGENEGDIEHWKFPEEVPQYQDASQDSLVPAGGITDNIALFYPLSYTDIEFLALQLSSASGAQ